MEDHELIEGCRKGSAKAQEMLYKVFSPKMYAICLSYAKDEDSAKDILQDSFIKIFNNIHLFVHDAPLEPWIRRIVVNTAIDYYRKSIKTIWKKTPITDDHDLPADDDTLRTINEKQLLGIIRELPAGCKVVFNLYVIEGFTHKEISNLLGITEGTSKSQFSYAKKMLKERIREIYGEDIYKDSAQLLQVNG